MSSKYRQNIVKISFVFRQTQFVIASVSLSLFSKKRAKMPVWSKICRHLSCKRTCFLRETKTCIDVIFLSNESKMRRLNRHGKTSPFDSMSYRNKIPQLQRAESLRGQKLYLPAKVSPLALGEIGGRRGRKEQRRRRTTPASRARHGQARRR